MKREKILTVIIILLAVIVLFVSLLLEDEDDGKNIESRATIGSLGGYPRDIEWNPDGTKIAATIWSPQEENLPDRLRVWNYPSLELEKEIEIEENKKIGEISWSPNGTLLAVRGGENSERGPGIIYIYNATNWERIKNLTGNFIAGSVVDWSWDGAFLATSDINVYGVDSRIVIWETSNWTNITIFSETIIVPLEWHPSNYTFATGHSDGTVRIYNSKGIPLVVLREHGGLVEQVCWSPDGTSLASGGDDGIILWDTLLWMKKGMFSGERYRGTDEIEWNPNGTLLASGTDYWSEDEITISSVEEMKIIAILTEHENYLWTLSWNHQNRLLASGSGDETIKIWELEDI